MNNYPFLKCHTTQEKNDNMCAIDNPNCLTDKKEIIVKLVDIYNKLSSDKIDVTLSKSDLTKVLSKKILYNKDLVNKIKTEIFKDKELFNQLRNIFLPYGPNNTNEWLNTVHINTIMTQIENIFTDFKFLGAVPVDINTTVKENYVPQCKNKFFFDTTKTSTYSQMECIELDKLYNNKKYKIGIVFNMDRHNQSGSHWTCFYADLQQNVIYYIDSVGTSPPKLIKNFIDNLQKILTTRNKKEVTIYINKKPHQSGNSECGVYSINFITRLLANNSKLDLENIELIPDDKIKNCRTYYFQSFYN